MSPTPIAVPMPPRGRTAQRLTWEFLPPVLRSEIEGRIGGPVVQAVSCDSGFTPGFASVLTTADGRSAFVKAANRVAQAPIAAAYAEEARKAGLLAGRVPAPRLRWSLDDPWVVLCFDAVEGRTPARPWQSAELERSLDLAEEIAAVTVEVPAELRLRTLVEDLPQLTTGWDEVALSRPDWPHLTEVSGLAQAFTDLPADRFAHGDLRDDNILLLDDGRALACDWNWPVLAPSWIDLVTLLVAAHGDGLDADELVAARSLTRDVPDDHLDAWLAALCGFMVHASDQPRRRSSPYLQQHAEWYAEAAWSWLCARRGWS